MFILVCSTILNSQIESSSSSSSSSSCLFHNPASKLHRLCSSFLHNLKTPKLHHHDVCSTILNFQYYHHDVCCTILNFPNCTLHHVCSTILKLSKLHPSSCLFHNVQLSHVCSSRSHSLYIKRIFY